MRMRFRRQLHLLEVGGRQRRPDRQARTRRHDGEAGLDAFANAKDAAVADRGQPHCAARHLAQHHARLGDGRLCHLFWLGGIDLQVRPVNGDGVTGMIAHNSNQRGVAGLRLPVRQVGVRQQIGAVGDSKTAATQIGSRRRAGDRARVIENEGDLARGVAFRLRRRRR